MRGINRSLGHPAMCACIYINFLPSKLIFFLSSSCVMIGRHYVVICLTCSVLLGQNAYHSIIVLSMLVNVLGGIGHSCFSTI